MGAIIETKMEVRGLAELSAALNELGENVEKRVLAKAVQWAGAEILNLAKQKAPRGTGSRRSSAGKALGHMADSLIAVTKKKKGSVTVTIGSETHGPLLHLVEFGTAPHAQPKLNRIHPGTKAQPFMRPALDEGGEHAIATFAESLEAGLKEEARKADRSARRARR